MYKVIKYFTDLQDNNYAYYVGDTFPRNGVEVGAERTAELSSDKNLQGVPLIEISIHAPRVGSDRENAMLKRQQELFQSTLPVWGATS